MPILPILLQLVAGSVSEAALRRVLSLVGIKSVAAVTDAIAGKAVGVLAKKGISAAAHAAAPAVEGALAGAAGSALKTGATEAIEQAPGWLARHMTPKAMLGAGVGASAMIGSNLAFMAPGMFWDSLSGGSDTHDAVGNIPIAQMTNRGGGASDNRDMGRVITESQLRQALSQYTGNDKAVDDLLSGGLS